MENASKALIIAGAILLSILLISLGIVIFNQAKSATDGSGIDQAQIQAFNSKLTMFEGSTTTGIQLKDLVELVLTNNGDQKMIDAGATITMTVDGTNVDNAFLTSSIANNARYTVDMTHGGEGGRINTITASKN